MSSVIEALRLKVTNKSANKDLHEVFLSDAVSVIEKLEKQNQILIEALEFYAQKRHPVYQEKAREALKQIGVE